MAPLTFYTISSISENEMREGKLHSDYCSTLAKFAHNSIYSVLLHVIPLDLGLACTDEWNTCNKCVIAGNNEVTLTET